MPLTLTIRNVPVLENGSPVSLVLDRRGARIGRTPTADWCLPDPARFISSNHCEIRYVDERFELVDQSTNGTYLLGQTSRLPVPYTINAGDVFVIGRFEIEASLDEASAAAAAAGQASPRMPEWGGWTSGTDGQDIAPQANPNSWGAPPAQSAISGGGPMAQAWAPPVMPASPAPDPWSAPQAATRASTWDIETPTTDTVASEWSSPAALPTEPAADDIWGKFAASNVVDWSRCEFGTPTPPPIIQPAQPLAPQQSPAPLPPAAPPIAQAQPFTAAAPPAPAPAAPQAPAPAAPDADFAQLLASAFVDPGQLKQGQAATAVVAGALLRQLVAGLFLLLEARARAKSQMGAEGTRFSPEGNNPLKFSRSPEQALLQLLNPPERGFMDAGHAVEDAFKDLQAHQMATLRAMQGALRATLDRFSPSAIRARAQDSGLLGKILPAARDAALWNAYEREFGGVVRGSDEAFMDIFAAEFRRAYEEVSR